VPEVVPHREHGTRRGGGRDHPIAFLHRSRHRLFHEHVNAGTQKVDRNGDVIFVGNGNNRGVDAARKIQMACIHMPGTCLAGNDARTIDGRIDAGNKVNPRGRKQRRQVVTLRDGAATYESDAHACNQYAGAEAAASRKSTVVCARWPASTSTIT
jgi:hypothetical protein